MIIIATALLFLIVGGCADNVPRVEDTGHTGAVIKASPQFGDAPLTVEFSGKGSYITGAGEPAYLWSFDDGNTVPEGIEIEHIFNAPGTYVVTLSVSDEGGKTDNAWAIIVVN